MNNNINKFNYVSNKEYEISDCNISYKAFLSLVEAQDGDTIYVSYNGTDIKGAFIYEFCNPKRAFWDRAFIHFTTKDDEIAVKWISNYFYSNNITVTVVGVKNNSTSDKKVV